MAYSTSTPPALLVPSFGGKASIWTYDSTHIISEVTTAAGFFSNGKALGMRVGDQLFGNSTAATQYMGKITAVSSTGATFVAYAT